MSNRVTDKQLYAQIEMLAKSMNTPVEWFHLGGSYGNTTLDIRYIDAKTKELTSGVTRLYTGTKGGLSIAIAFMLEVKYQTRRNNERLEQKDGL